MTCTGKLASPASKRHLVFEEQVSDWFKKQAARRQRHSSEQVHGHDEDQERRRMQHASQRGVLAVQGTF